MPVDQELLQEIESCLTDRHWPGALVLEPEPVSEIDVGGLASLKRSFSHLLIVGLTADKAPVPKNTADVAYHDMLASISERLNDALFVECYEPVAANSISPKSIHDVASKHDRVMVIGIEDEVQDDD